MKYLYPLCVLITICLVYYAGRMDAKPDPKLDACARTNNVYRCEYVAEPVLPTPTKETVQ